MLKISGLEGRMNICPKNGLLVMLYYEIQSQFMPFAKKNIGVEEQKGVQDLAYNCVFFFCPYLA